LIPQGLGDEGPYSVRFNEKVIMKKRKASSSPRKSHPQESSSGSARPQLVSLPEEARATAPAIQTTKVVRPWPKGLRFRKSPDGSTTAVMSHGTATEVAHTYFRLANDLHLARTFIINASKPNSHPPRVEELIRNLGGTGLAKAADKLDWETWVDVFSQTNPPQPRAMALMFLKTKTGLTPKTLKTYISRPETHKK
jgi:hypothetical protein